MEQGLLLLLIWTNPLLSPIYFFSMHATQGHDDYGYPEYHFVTLDAFENPQECGRIGVPGAYYNFTGGFEHLFKDIGYNDKDCSYTYAIQYTDALCQQYQHEGSKQGLQVTYTRSQSSPGPKPVVTKEQETLELPEQWFKDNGCNIS